MYCNTSCRYLSDKITTAVHFFLLAAVYRPFEILRHYHTMQTSLDNGTSSPKISHLFRYLEISVLFSGVFVTSSVRFEQKTDTCCLEPRVYLFTWFTIYSRVNESLQFPQAFAETSSDDLEPVIQSAVDTVDRRKFKRWDPIYQ